LVWKHRNPVKTEFARLDLSLHAPIHFECWKTEDMGPDGHACKGVDGFPQDLWSPLRRAEERIGAGDEYLSCL